MIREVAEVVLVPSLVKSRAPKSVKALPRSLRSLASEMGSLHRDPDVSRPHIIWKMFKVMFPVSRQGKIKVKFQSQIIPCRICKQMDRESHQGLLL